MKKKIFFMFILLTILTGCLSSNEELNIEENKELNINKNEEDSSESIAEDINNDYQFDIDYEINLDLEVEVKRGDNIWNLSKEQIKLSITESKWNELGEAKQTYLIDALKDEIVENHLDYGIEEDPDNLMIGTKIKFAKALENNKLLKAIFNQVEELNEEETANIIINNQALQRAADSGLQITSNNTEALIQQFKE